MPHIRLSALLDHITKTKPLDTQSAKHVESCSHCRSDLRWLGELEHLRNFEPPEWAVDAVIREFKERYKKAA
jgi:hypothetical protein